MKKYILSLGLILIAFISYSQSDNCVTGTIINLDAAGTGCATGTTVGSTSENIMFGGCNAAPANEVWYTYVATGSQNDFTITPSGLTNSEIVLYTGGCPSTTGTLITCGTETGGNTLNLSWGFTVGTQVWVGIMSNAGNDGGFDVCVDSYNPPAGGGNACAGAIPLCDKNVTTTIPDMSIFTASGAAPSCFPGGGNQDVWFQFTVTQTGSLEWDALSTLPGTGVEWDWTVYDITNGCVGSGNETEVACNYNFGNESSAAGMTTGAAGNCPESAVTNDPALEYCDPITVTAGNTYAIQIDNYTNTVATGLDFSFGAGMTAEIAPDVDFSISPTTVTCGTSVNVTITDNSTGIPTWDFGDGTTFVGNNPPPHNYTTPGTYAITASIAGACSDVQTEYVQLFGPLVTVPDTTTETCVGDCDGSISLTTSGGSGVYSYLWAPGGETTPSITNQCDGNYSVTITDAVCGNIVENITLSPGPSCVQPCLMTSIEDTVGLCDPLTNLFPRYGTVTFNDPPTTGLLTFTDCYGNADTLYPPFTSPASYSFLATSDGTASCDVVAVFTADPTCTMTIANTYPAACTCPADAGTVTAGMFGDGNTNYILCHNDTIAIVSNGDDTPPLDVGPIGLPPSTYDPGITYAIYNCPPTPNTPPHLDACYTGYVTGTISNMADVNADGAAGGLLAFLIGQGFAFTDNTVYYAPVTLYNQTDLVFNTNCVDVGPATTVQYLPEITTSNPTENCQDSSFTITVNGGYPELLGGNFTASNLLPATASFVNTTAADGGTIQINGLQNGDMYSFDIQDVNGCPISVTGGPFVGLPYANAGVDDSTCTLTYAMNPTPSFGTGTWSGPGNITFTPNVNTPGATATSTIPGTFTLTWTEDNGGGCTSADNVDITFSDISYSAVVVDATCGNPDGVITITAQDGITAYQYSNDNGVTFQPLDSFVNLTAGPYNIVVEDAIGCQATGIENVNNLGAPSIDSFTLTDPLCNGDCNGEIVVHASGGAGGFQFSIDGGALQADSTFTGLCGATTYTFMVQDALGCQASRDTLLSDPTLLVLDSINFTNVDCNGNANGTVDVYATGGTGTLNYSIDNGVTYGVSPNFAGLAAGTYYVWVRDTNNCTVNDSVVITEPQPLSIPNVVDSVVCFGQANGQIVVTPQGGTTPYTYAWTSSADTDSIETGLGAGNVTVTVTDSNLCFLDSTFTVYEPAQFTYTTDSQNSNCNQPDGWATVVGFAGGTGTYAYQWDAAAANQVTDTAFNLIPGNYDVTITDGNLCDTIITITVGNNPSVVLDSLVGLDPLCNGDLNGEVEVFASGGTGVLQYSIDGGALQADSVFTGLAGATTYLFTVEDAVGCQDTMSTILVEPTLLVLDSITSTDVVCNGDDDGTINVYATGGTGTLNYSIDNGVTYGASSNFTGLAPGTYYVWVQDGNNCTVNDSVVIAEPQPLSIPNLVDSVICYGTATGSVQTLPQGGIAPYTYAWTSSANVGNNETNLPAGNVTVTVTDNNLCTLDSTFVVYEPAQFTYTTDSQNANCNQPDGWATVVGFAGGTGTYTYQWDANAGNQVTDTAFNLTPGSYDVTITDGNLCDTILTITVGNNPSFTTSITGVINATCDGGSDGEATANGSDPLATYNYLWDANAGNQATQTATGLDSGIYYVTITDAATGCFEIDSVVITDPTPVIINSVSPDVTICSGQTTNITATATGGSGTGYVYTWDNGLGTGQTHTVGPAPGSVTIYNVTAVDDNNCPSDVGSVTVTVHPDLSVLMSNDDTICPGAPLNISALASLGNGGPYTYSWTPNSAIDNTNSPNPVVNPTQTTTYYVTINDGCSPAITDSVVVNIHNLPQPLALADTLSLCEQPVLPVTFYNLTDTTNGMLDTASVIWNFGDGITSNNVNTWDTIQHTYTVPGSYVVTMTVSSTALHGGCTVTDTVIPDITIHPLPTPDFISNPNPTTMFEPEVDFADLTPGNITYYHWNFGGLDSSNYQNPSYQFPDDTSGTYLVTLTVTDANQCENSITKTVIVRGEFGLFIPNTFTPDFDNKNDVFIPQGFGIVDEGYGFMIFNRWGEKIYETHDWGDGWDGSYKGKLVQQDTYVWKIVYKDVNGERHEKHGHVNVIK